MGEREYRRGNPPIPPRNRYEREVLAAKRQIIRRALEETRGNVRAAARRLGITRYVIYRWYMADPERLRTYVTALRRRLG